MTINRGPILTSVHLVGALAVLGVASLLILNSPGLVTLGLWMLVLPGLILIAIVNVFFYLLAFSVGWFVLVGRKGRAVAIKGGLFAVVFFAIGLPALLDLRTRAWVWWATVRDRATASKIGPAPSVGLQLADQTRTDGRCDDLCLALLYNGVAQRVDTIPTKADAEGTKPTAFSYRIERRGTAPKPKMYSDRTNRGWPKTKGGFGLRTVCACVLPLASVWYSSRPAPGPALPGRNSSSG